MNQASYCFSFAFLPYRLSVSVSAHISRFDFVKRFYVFDFFCLFKNSDCLFSNQTNTSKDTFEAGEPNMEKKTLIKCRAESHSQLFLYKCIPIKAVFKWLLLQKTLPGLSLNASTEQNKQ